jgi:hypothetical protein
MSLRPAIPWRVALPHCSPPLHQPFVMVNRVAGTVNHHLAGAGEFSTGILGNFQPELTGPFPICPVQASALDGSARIKTTALFQKRRQSVVLFSPLPVCRLDLWRFLQPLLVPSLCSSNGPREDAAGFCEQFRRSLLKGVKCDRVGEIKFILSCNQSCGHRVPLRMISILTSFLPLVSWLL